MDRQTSTCADCGVEGVVAESHDQPGVTLCAGTTRGARPGDLLCEDCAEQ